MITKPNALTRLKAAMQFYQHGWRKFQMQPKQTKKIPFIWPSWYNGQPQWQLINYEAYASEGFSANAVVYSAIMFKVRSIAISPLRAYTGDPEQPELLPMDHPLQALCLRPNRFQSWPEFQGLAEIYLNLSGNCYIALERGEDQKDQVTAMYLLRPDRVFIVPVKNREQMIGFWYVPEGQSWVDGRPYLPQDMMHIKLPNPHDPLDGLGYGLSPLSPGAHNTEVDNDLTKFFRLFFKGGAMPPGVLEFDVPIDPDEASRAREQWMEIYGGYDNWKDVAVVDSGGKYKRVGYTFDEMDVSAIDARNESRIVGPFGVPLTLIESRPELVSSTYDNKQTDWTMFWQSTMTPELIWFEKEYQYFLQGDGSDFVKFDFSNVPALTMTQEVRIDKFAAAYQAGAVITDEYRAELGLDPNLELDEIEEEPLPKPEITTEDMPEAEDEAKIADITWVKALSGDGVLKAIPIIETRTKKLIGTTKIDIPLGVPFELSGRWWQLKFIGKDAFYVQEIEDQTTKGMIAALDMGSTTEEDKAKKKEVLSRSELLTKADQFAVNYEVEFGNAASSSFEQDLIYILAIITDMNNAARDNRGSLNWVTAMEAISLYFASGAATNWQRQFTLPLNNLMTEWINDLNDEFGQEFSAADLLGQEWFNEYTIKFAQSINANTEEAVRRLIEQGVNEGWSIPTTKKNLETMFQQWMAGDLTPEAFGWLEARMPEFRRELIARTETLRAANTVGYRLYGEWGVEEHEWLSAHDDRVRHPPNSNFDHVAADGEIVKIGTPFVRTGEPMLYPLDPAGSAGNVINCRCTTRPVV